MSDSSPCTRCAAPVSAGARFCSVCGAPVSPSGEVAEDQLLARLRQATLGEYDVLRELGRGGMAAVYLAWDRELARYVAVKVLLPELAHQATMSQRFLQEARTAANLDDHPSVVRVYRAKESQGLRYFVMKYVDGCSLDLLLRAAEPFPVDLAAHVVDQVALALQYAHDHGVVHRDVKPGNVLLDRTGNVVVTDFGIAKIAEADQLTRTGFAIGTPHYMSPEQWRVEPLGPAADQYALGVVAYHMIAGALPFEGTHYEIQEQHLRAEPVTLEARRAGVPPELSAIVGLMLGKRPELRFPDLRSVSQALAAMPRDPVPMLRERLARLIPAAGPETGRDATGAGTASDPSLPHSFLRPTPYTPASSLPPVLPASPITPWQPAAAPFGGYTPPGAGGGSAFGPPAAPPGGGTTVPTTPALAGAAAAELTPPEVPSAAPAVAAPAVAAVRSAPTPPSTYAPPAPEARPAPPPPDAAVPDAPPAASPTPGLLGGLGVGLGARLGGTPERPSLSPAPTAPPAPADSTASPLSATESFNALFEPARVDSPAPAERAAPMEPATASAAPATPAADAPSGSVAVDEATRATEPPAVFAADGAALAATARPAPRDAGGPDGRRPAAPPFDEPPAATPREEYRADDLPALVSGADVPAPAARRRSPVPMLAAGGALLAVAAGVFATTRGGRTEARAVVPADSVGAGAASAPGSTPVAPDTARAGQAPPVDLPADPGDSTTAAKVDSAVKEVDDLPIAKLDPAPGRAAADTTARIQAAVLIPQFPVGVVYQLAQGDSVRLVSTVVNNRKERLPKAKVQYTSSDPTRAVRRNSQYLYGLATGGPVTITATSGRAVRTIQVLVTPPRATAAPTAAPQQVPVAPAPTAADARAGFDQIAAVLLSRNVDNIVRRLGPTAADGTPTREFAEWVRDAREFDVGRPSLGDAGGEGDTRSVGASVRLRHQRGGLKGTGYALAQFNIGLRYVNGRGWVPYTFQLAKRLDTR